jgi:CBS domain containing-hemolysin-like protein
VDNTQGDDASLEDECAWYAIAYLVDTTLGLVLAIWFLKALDMLAHQNDWVSLKHSGVYEGVDGVLHFANQTVAWMVVLTLVKIVIYYFMVLFSGALAVAGALLFEPFQSNIRFELLFVMIFFPGVLNLIYFWIADSYLKAKKEHAGAHEDEDAEAEMTAKQEGLLTEEERRAQEEPGPTSWISMATFV